LLKPGVYLRWKLGVWQGSPPFEAPWMLDYVDRQLRVDASQTRRTLGWAPAPRLEVTRRLLVMIENLKSRREVWNQLNLAALTRVSDRPNLMVAAALDDLREELTEQVVETINDPANASRLPGYQRMDRDVLTWYVTLFYQILATAVRTRDRQLVRQHAQIIAYRRRHEGFEASEMQVFLDVFRRVVTEALRERDELKGLEQAIHDHVTLTCQLTADDVADVFDTTFQPPPEILGRYQEINVPRESADLERVVHELQDICGDIGPLYSGSDLPSRPVGG
jgi:hypothetical protein